MKNYLLFRSKLDNLTLALDILPGQPIFKELSDDIKYYKITYDWKMIGNQAMGSIFIAKDYTVVDDAKQIIIKTEDMMPILEAGGKFTFPMVASDPEKQDLIDYFIDQLLVNPEFDKDQVKTYAEEFKAYGYEFDWEEKTSVKITPTGTASPGGSNLKRSISASYPVPKKEDIGFHIDPILWVRLVRNVLRGENMLLSGPTGCGKTELIQHLAKAMGKDLNIVDMGTVLDAAASLAGVHRLNEEGKSEFDYAPFAKYIQEPCIILLDEVNRSSREANNYLFPCLDGRRYMPVDTAVHGGPRKIEVHPDTVFIGTANIGAEYSGTNRIDKALMDRFELVELDYPEEEVEIGILQIRTSVDEQSATALVKIANETRKACKAQDIMNAVSVRHTLKAASYISDGFDLKEAISNVYFPLFEDGDGQSDRNEVRTMMAAL